MDKKELVIAVIETLRRESVCRGLSLQSKIKVDLNTSLPILRVLRDMELIVCSGTLASPETAEDAFFSAAPELYRVYPASPLIRKIVRAVK